MQGLNPEVLLVVDAIDDAGVEIVESFARDPDTLHGLSIQTFLDEDGTQALLDLFLRRLAIASSFATEDASGEENANNDGDDNDYPKNDPANHLPLVALGRLTVAAIATIGRLAESTAVLAVLDGNGALTCERQASDGSTVTGAFDVVPCVEAFIQEHPDFSNNGARGILGLTGYNGILGYRTDDALATSTDNRYAAKYGVFDTAAEKEAAAPVIEALKSAGWEFACNGYDGTNYGSDEDAVSADLTKWNESVGTLVGNTTILLFPSGTDSRGWKAYDESDPVYQILKKQGFLYYGSMDISGTKTQLTEQYIRCSYMNVDGYRMYQDLYKDAGRFTGILDFQEIYDSKRPMAANETDTQATGGEDE